MGIPRRRTRACDWCGKEFSASWNWQKEAFARCCSPRCMALLNHTEKVRGQ